MSEPKFSVGQEVDYGDARGPATVVAVHVQGYLYDLQWGSRGGLVTGYRECDLRPHVPKLEVGDPVRWKKDHSATGIVRAIEGDEVCYLSKSRNGLIVTNAGNLERVSDEADIDSEPKAVSP
jgi:hypothetical protein